MKLLILILVLLLFVMSGEGAKIEFTMNAEGYGNAMYNSVETSNGHSSTEYRNAFASEHLMTGNGQFKQQLNEKLDPTINNRYEYDSTVSANNGILFDTSVSSDNKGGNVTRQNVDATYSGYLTDAVITTAKFVNGANLSIGQEAAWNGVGMYTGDIRQYVKASPVDGKTKIDYTSEGRKRFAYVTNATGGMIVRPEYDYTDFDDVYSTNKTVVEQETTIMATGVLV